MDARINLPPMYHDIMRKMMAYVGDVRKVGYFMRCASDGKDEELLKLTLDPFVDTACEVLLTTTDEQPLGAEDIQRLTARVATCRKAMAMWPDSLGRAVAERDIVKTLLGGAKDMHTSWLAAQKNLPKGEDFGIADKEAAEMFSLARERMVDLGLKNMSSDAIETKSYRRWHRAEGRYRRWLAEGHDKETATKMGLGYFFEEEKTIDAKAAAKVLDQLPVYKEHA